MSVPVSFAQFLVSLGSSAMVHLGETADPGSGSKQPNAAMARHTLDVLTLLKGKTEGNLDDDERRLLDALISEIGSKLAALGS
jgi:hypothetical protein